MAVSFTIGDYTYEQNYDVPASNDTISVRVKDNNYGKTTYEDIPATVTYNGKTYYVTSMCTIFSPQDEDEIGCFEGCELMVEAPSIPTSVLDMSRAFYGCEALVTPPTIPVGVTDMKSCFSGCTSLLYAPAIPSHVDNMDACFYGCTSLSGDIYITAYNFIFLPHLTFAYTTQPIVLHSTEHNVDWCDALADTATNGNVYVNVSPEQTINFIDTEMKYNTNVGLEPLSLQTNANLVQCEVPDLINGGTITTNVNNALVDLYHRNKSTTINGIYSYASGNGQIVLRGTPAVVNGNSLAPSDIYRFPFGFPFGFGSYTRYKLLQNTTYRFTGGINSNGISTILYLEGHQSDGSTGKYFITASGYFVVREGKNGSAPYNFGYEALTFTVPSYLDYCEVYVGFVNAQASYISTEIRPKITKVGDV